MLINKYFGPQINASMTIANQVSSHTMMLSGAMVGAFQPAITNACGARKYEWMRLMAFRACKFGTLLILIFLIPLAVEIHEVLSIWLKNPPPYTESLCLCMLGVLVIDKSTVGHMVAVNANGKVALYQAFLGSACHFFIISMNIDIAICCIARSKYVSLRTICRIEIKVSI
jgi:Na+-driven multidrug efflux pump